MRECVYCGDPVGDSQREWLRNKLRDVAIAHRGECPSPMRPCLACGKAIGADDEVTFDEVGSLGSGPVHAATCTRLLISDDFGFDLGEGSTFGRWGEEPPL